MAPSRGRDAKRRLISKRAASHDKIDASDQSNESVLPFPLQQRLVDVFAAAFPARLASDLNPTLQQVKQHLYNRDFDAAFGSLEYLEAYTVRWSTSRAVGYLQIFQELLPHLADAANGEPTSTTLPRELCMTCLGGGAGAELVAAAGLIALQEGSSAPLSIVRLTLIDSAPWAPVIAALTDALHRPPPLTPYASAAARAAASPLLESSPSPLHAAFHRVNVLDAVPAAVAILAPALATAHCVTLLFTLNELYAASVPATQALLQRLSDAAAPGTLLLVVDSPGSYARVALGGAEGRQYPMRWLLEHALFEGRSDGADGVRWETCLAAESRWFRLPGDKGGRRLRYPIALEDMRVQMYLYRRV